MRGIAVTSCLASSETAEMAASVAHHAKKPRSATGRHDSLLERFVIKLIDTGLASAWLRFSCEKFET